ncbi:MAG TPA: cob(I)yrinic acid a,c-diamide adenosyltransferase [Methylomusa anaerophila]|uniref:Cob(I)yrinic acid a,c-diamide adenosyltransferase n=1 Tax=Methylomusa anaerophila TaxID=1930071 RepID=A0A348AL96_9FIRM|nr:cob(I)yrinic acid a,c-diamide adenosyltransferase [Methylomusa anaerophila]BBB91844.1 Cob(I)yrinic acid a,c-diamide adenosyltransferase [Methylomusa anaerophila]HML88423.1 cob(I)yrinic acid a,c-diamide adenosyltransferase [Methylomusa anaerophila]
MAETRGLIIVNTGNGKGKTTAALGVGMRAWGQGLKVLVLQFIKGNWKYGELQAAARMGDDFVIRQLGEGFVRDADSDAKAGHQAVAQAALADANREIMSGNWDMIILDEINYAIKFGLVPVDKVIELLQSKPAALHLVLTGREARQEIIDLADLVTEMKEIKHPLKQGIKAQKGIEF